VRITLLRVVAVVGILATAALTPAAQAQVRGRPVRGGFAKYYANPAVRPVVVTGPMYTTIGLQTTVAVPDGGSVTLGGYSQLSEGRSEFGVPVLGGVPYAGRGFRNVGYGRTTVYRRVTASVRVIDLRAEEYRQTGVRSR
jgi:hypothetical protein